MHGVTYAEEWLDNSFSMLHCSTCFELYRGAGTAVKVAQCRVARTENPGQADAQDHINRSIHSWQQGSALGAGTLDVDRVVFLSYAKVRKRFVMFRHDACLDC